MVQETLNNRAKKATATRVIAKFVYFMVILNSFVFNGINYLQIKECAIGTICALAYSNILN